MSWVRNFTSSDAPFGAVEETKMALTPLNRTRIQKYLVGSRYQVIYSGEPGSSSGSSVFQVSGTDVAAGWKSSNWRALVRAGSQAGTPYTREVIGVESNHWTNVRYSQFGNFGVCVHPPPGYHPKQSRTDIYQSSPFQGVWPQHGPNQLSRADSQAVARLRGEILAEYEHLNMLISLGELASTARQLVRPYEKMRLLMLAHLDRLASRLSRISARSKPKSKKLAVREALSSTWLETTLGVLPTISDTRSIAEALARYDSGADLRRGAVKGYGEVVSTTSVPPAASTIGGHARVWTNEQTVTRDIVVYRAGLEVQSSPDKNPANDVLRLCGFNPINFIPTVWEVIPFSWVVDYFVTIGQALNMNIVNTGNVKWIVKSTKRDSRKTNWETPDISYIVKTLGTQCTGASGTPGKSVTFRTNVAREVVVGAKVPYLIPRFKTLSEINPLQVANLTALISVKTKRVGSILKSLRI